MIDASHCYEPRRKSIGTKRNDITDLCRNLIVEAYGDFQNKVYGGKGGGYCESKIFDSVAFGYNKIVVERPLRLSYTVTDDSLRLILKGINDFRNNQNRAALFDSMNDILLSGMELKAALNLDNLDNLDNDALVAVCKGYVILESLKGIEYKSKEALEKAFVDSPHNDGRKKLTLSAFSRVVGYDGYETKACADAEIVKDKKGKPVADSSLRDTENVPLDEDIDAYFAREVLPYAPDAWIDRSKTKVGYEIPMTRYFYEYQAPERVEDIMERITALESEISASLNELFGKAK